MNAKLLEKYLDRYGAGLEHWPAEAASEARALLDRSGDARRRYDAFLAIESGLYASRPRVDSVCAMQVVSRAVREIRDLPARRSLADSIAFALGGVVRPIPVPMPRVAFVVAATALGFAVGLVLGAPAADRMGSSHGLPVIASADDVLF